MRSTPNPIPNPNPNPNPHPHPHPYPNPNPNLNSNQVDLDIRDMIAETDLSKAKLWYTSGGNSQKSGGRTRTVRGFSTAAKKKSKSSEISNPLQAPATRQSEPPSSSARKYT